MTIKIFIVDDHPIILDGLIQLLSQTDNFEIAGTADCYESALCQIESINPDVAIIDVGLSAKSGIDLIQELKHITPQLSTIVFSMYDELTYAPKALRAGAKGFVMKSEPPAKLIAAINDVYKGKIVVNECVKDLIFDHFVVKGKDANSLLIESKLTQKEENIFRLIGQGNNTAHIAAKLSISAKTVQTHKDNIRHKLHLESSSELYHRAIIFVENREHNSK